MFLFLNIFWFIRTFKHVLFWLYLWQLKEYHIGRFLDHFRTYKGKKLIYNYLLLFKVILAVLFVFDIEFFSLWFSILFLIYFIESAIFLKQFWSKSLKRPVRTFKTLLLTFVSFAVSIIFLFWVSLAIKDEPHAPVYLLLFDILTPVIVSLAVLLMQPFFVIARNNILRKAAKKIKGFKNLTVVGITGSYGKTSTKEFLATILSKKFKVLKTKQHQNSEIGIANCILNDLNKDHEIFAVEMGSYKKGGIKLLCDMVKPKIGIVTGVNEQHLALFGSMEKLLSAEGGGELAKALPQDGLLVLNGDNKYCLDLYKRSDINKKIYSINKDKIDLDIHTEGIEVAQNSISFLAIDKNKHLAHFNVNVLGKHNVQNLLAAILAAKELGMSFDEIAEACKDIKQFQAGMNLKEGKHGIKIIDSSYSANSDGVLADLEYLSIFPKKKIIVMPCLIELGPKSKEVHEKIGKKIGEICDLAIITSKDKFDDIKRGAIESGIKEGNILFCEKPEDIYSMVTLFCAAGDTILLEGRVPVKLIKLLVGSE